MLSNRVISLLLEPSSLYAPCNQVSHALSCSFILLSRLLAYLVMSDEVEEKARRSRQELFAFVTASSKLCAHVSDYVDFCGRTAKFCWQSRDRLLALRPSRTCLELVHTDCSLLERYATANLVKAAVPTDVFSHGSGSQGTLPTEEHHTRLCLERPLAALYTPLIRILILDQS